jgi:plastocyanin
MTSMQMRRILMRRILMRRFPTGRLLMAAMAVAACGGDDPAAPDDPENVADVYTPGSIFSPFTANIRAGGTVRFHMQRAPDGDGHNAIFTSETPGAPDDVPVVVDTTVSRRFNARGTFPYICTVHPGMAGEIIVE